MSRTLKLKISREIHLDLEDKVTAFADLCKTFIYYAQMKSSTILETWYIIQSIN